MLILGKLVKDAMNKETFKNKNNKMTKQDVFNSIWYSLIILFLSAVPAILISQKCNPNNKIAYGILAFFFSDIYIFQWAIKKLLMKQPDYCPMP